MTWRKIDELFDKCETRHQPEYRKFSVDPQITSIEVLQSILIKAFDIKGISKSSGFYLEINIPLSDKSVINPAIPLLLLRQAL
ncbi:hypothetical protein E2986_13184 [Frieseomelitta varia]|uniref:Uncharacterized protein n=1 Tax=Frieseomelitta varia TaxID=561572 RepID=A0A833RC30_9HYME|nr:hypothetical protein E2986_13184 [Frieseomelitta varia]